jgi:hypothetical protein
VKRNDDNVSNSHRSIAILEVIVSRSATMIMFPTLIEASLFLKSVFLALSNLSVIV